MTCCLECGGELAGRLTAEQVPEVLLWLQQKITTNRFERAVRDKVAKGCVLFPKSGVAICATRAAEAQPRRTTKR